VIASPPAAQDRYGVRVEENVPARMRDGTILRSDVAWPIARAGETQTFPVLLTRTPYQKRPLPHLAERGYIAVSQDVRGIHASDGDFDPVCQPCGALADRDDGYDTTLWAAGLDASDGRVGVFGLSYPAWEAWELAISRPAPLVAMYVSGMAVTSTSVEPLPRPGRRLQWFVAAGAPDIRRRRGLPGPQTRADADRLWHVERHKWLWFLPWSELPEHALGPMTPYCKEYFQHSTRDHFRFAGQHHHVDVPVFHRTGWYDRWVHTIDHFTAMRTEAPSEHARQSQRLLVGPWGHTGTLTRKVGDFDFGPDAEMTDTDLMLRWFDFWLQGAQNGALDEPPVRYFMMGRNEWRAADTWPPRSNTPTIWYFASGGHANTASGDGALVTSPSGRGAEDRYAYDPRDPVPTVWPLDDQNVPLDHRPIDWRQDLLVYVTDPLGEPVEITGVPSVDLWASSSAFDTDFITRLADVHPDGRVQPLVTGIVRARHREGYDRPPRLLSPGVAERYAIPLGPLAHCFLPGHRIRLEVTSSDFPNYDRNHNSGLDDFSDATLAVAHQTVLHGADHPSGVTLPVLAAA